MADERDREHREGWEGRLRQGWEGRGREDWGEQRGEWGREYWPRERWGTEREGWGTRGRESWGESPYYRGRMEWGGEGRWGREGGWGAEGGEGRGFYGGRGYYGAGYPGGMSYYGGGFGGGYGGAYGYGQQPRGRYAGRGPRNYQRSDDRIRDDINEQLTRHPDIDASDMEVQVTAGTVALTGTVESREMKRLAEDVAENVFGVKDVNNQLRLQQPAMSGQGQGQPGPGR